MVILKQLAIGCMLWCSVCVSQTISYQQFMKAVPLKQEHNQGINISEDNNCFCPKKDPNAIPIPDQLNEGNGVNRLVVYFYIEPITGKTITFVPKPTKQILIPDMDLEAGDELLPLANEDIFNFIFYHPSVIVRKLSTLVHEDNNYDQNSNSQIYFDRHDENKTSDMSNENGVKLSDILSPGNQDKTTFIPVNIPSPVINQAEPENMNDENKPIWEPQLSSWVKKDKNLDNSAVHKTEAENENEKDKGSWESHVSSITNVQNPKTITSVEKGSVENENSENVIDEETQSWDQLSTPTSSKQITKTHKNQEKDVNDYVSFNNWFKNQMEDVQMVSPMNVNDIDIVMLKKMIEKTLTEHGMVVSTDGVLKDASGNDLDMANLMLRPMLIGDSLGYNNLLKVTDQYYLPSDLPYLKSILLTILNPPKILGIIPLGKTYFSREALLSPGDKLVEPTASIKHAPNLIANKTKSINSHLKCQIGKCGLQKPDYEFLKLLPYHEPHSVNSNNIQSRRSKESNSQNNNYRRFPALLKGQNNSKLKENLSINDIATLGMLKIRKDNTLPDNNEEKNMYATLNDIGTETGNAIFSHAKVINEYLNKLTKYAPGVEGLKEKEIREETQPHEESGDDLSVEYPETRIIGGSAATSSGTPISIRGRSGWISVR